MEDVMDQPLRKGIPFRIPSAAKAVARFLAQRFRRPGTVTVICAIVVVGLAILTAVPLFCAPINPQDEGLVLVYSDRILRGAVPHRDYFTAYGPGGFWLMAGAFKLFGPSLFVERGLGLIYRLAILLAVFLFGLRKGRIVAVTGGILSGLFLLANGLLALAYLLALALAMWSLWLLARQALRDSGTRAKWALLSAGVLAGFIPAARPDVVFVAQIAAAVPLLLLLAPARRLVYAAGWLLGVFPLLVHAWIVGPKTLWVDCFIEPVFRYGPSRRLPVPPEALESKLFLTMIVLGAMTVLAMGVLRFRADRRHAEGRTYLSLGILCVCLLPYALQRADTTHFRSVACVIVGLLPLAIAVLLDHLSSAASRRLAHALAASIAINCVLLVDYDSLLLAESHDRVSLGLAKQEIFWVSNRGRSIPFETTEDRNIVMAAIKDVESISKPGDRLFIGPQNLRRLNWCDVFLYFLLPQLSPASYFMEMNQGSTNRDGPALARDIASAKVVILNDSYDQAVEPNASRKQGPVEPAQVVEEKFTVYSRHGPLTVLLRQNPLPDPR
jgi:hypothetical protein